LIVDPGVAPEQVFNLGRDDYGMRLAGILAQPDDTDAWDLEYLRHLHEAAVRHPTYRAVELYWEGLFDPTQRLDRVLEGVGFTDAQATALVAQVEPAIVAIKETFEATHASEIALRRQDIIDNGGLNPDRAGLELYQEDNLRWRASRLSAG
jgi:hypothetical protein